jgi:hypothetical protein
MEIEKALKKEVVDNLASGLRNLINSQRRILAKMRKAHTVEEFMLLKQVFVRRQIDCLPFGSESCYFCFLHKSAAMNWECNACEYGKIHGQCLEDGSHYKNIMAAKGRLDDALIEYFDDDEYKPTMQTCSKSSDKEEKK